MKRLIKYLKRNVRLGSMTSTMMLLAILMMSCSKDEMNEDLGCGEYDKVQKEDVYSGNDEDCKIIKAFVYFLDGSRSQISFSDYNRAYGLEVDGTRPKGSGVEVCFELSTETKRINCN